MTVAAGLPERWRLDRPSDLLWARFQRGAVVYHRRSGKTHFLNATAVTLLDRLGFGPMGVEEAAAAVAGVHTADLSDEFIAEIGNILRHFERAALIDRLCP